MTPGLSSYDQQLAAALEESAEELYEMAPCGYITTTVDGRIARVNRRVTEWLGYERSELTGGKRVFDLLTAGGRIFWETHLNLLLRMQTAVDEIALDMVCKDGRVLPVLINARQKRSASGEPILNRFTVFNASERRMYERQLLVARDLYRTTLASIGDGVVTTDATGRINFLNAMAETLSGWTSEEAEGKPIEEVLILRREGDSAMVENPVMQALREGVIAGLASQTFLAAKDGRQIPIDDSASPIRDSNGNMVGAVLVFRDITAQRQTAKSLQAAHEKLKASTTDLRRSNEDLSQFAHVASHDLRSPLNTVIQFAQLLEQQHGELLEREGGLELLKFVIDAAGRMRRLIEDLLSYATVTSADLQPQAPVDAGVVVEKAIANLQNLIEESQAVVSYDVLPAVALDETHLLQLFQNLISNAIHYRSEAAPRIHLSAAGRGDDWLFSCKDNGIGIDPAYHLQIFEAFKRLHGADRSGSGIGLAVCKRIVERFGGRIWVESQEGQGSTFFFTLPKTL